MDKGYLAQFRSIIVVKSKHELIRKLISLLINAFFCIYELCNDKLHYFRTFTEWGLLLTNAYFIFSLFSTSPWLQTVFQIVWTNEAVITFVFWIVLIPIYIVFPNDVPSYDTNPFSIVVQVLVHVTPFTALTFEFVKSRYTFSNNGFVGSYVLLFSYAMADGLIVLSGKREAYPVVMTWHDYISCIALVVLNILIVTIYLIAVRITSKRKLCLNESIPSNMIENIE